MSAFLFSLERKIRTEGKKLSKHRPFIETKKPTVIIGLFAIETNTFWLEFQFAKTVFRVFVCAFVNESYTITVPD
jgi:hypothetical protein